jgi:hypothetical protein
MAIALNHTIVHARDRHAAARSFADLLGLPEPHEFGPFSVVEMANGVSLDFADSTDPVTPQHYAFLVSEEDFDGIYARIRDRHIPHWADPRKAHPEQCNTNDGGRGVYWESPDGHFLEILTVPYGGWPQSR